MVKMWFQPVSLHHTHLCLCQTCIMMPTKLSTLDMAERGDLHASLGEETPRQVDGREAHRSSEPTVQAQASVVQAQDEGLGE